jgi:hypothetical protein
MPIDSSMPDPQWGNVLIHPQEKKAPVGDPTRWGALDTTTIVENAFAQSSTQIIWIKTRDSYSRGWSVVGALTMPVSVWDGVAAVLASLIVSMGVGQVQLIHKICLWTGGGAVGAPGGLCYTQDVQNGGPYLNPDPVLETVNGVVIAYKTRVFCVIGGLVGQSLSIVGEYGTLGANPDLPAPARLSLIVTPYAAGEGL